MRLTTVQYSTQRTDVSNKEQVCRRYTEVLIRATTVYMNGTYRNIDAIA